MPGPNSKTAGGIPLADSFVPASDYERSDHQSFYLPSSGRYVGRIAFRDQLDWAGAARVLTATNFRRPE
jgi:hypothetical protein